MNKLAAIISGLAIIAAFSLFQFNILEYNGFSQEKVTDEEIEIAKSNIEESGSWEIFDTQVKDQIKIFSFGSERGDAEVILRENDSALLAKEVNIRVSDSDDEVERSQAQALYKARSSLDELTEESEPSQINYKFSFDVDGKEIDVEVEDGYVSKEVEYGDETDSYVNLDE